MPWTELGAATCRRQTAANDKQIARPIGLESATNFLTRPPYEPYHKPLFDRGRFKQAGGRRDTNVESVDWAVSAGNLDTIPGATGAILTATWQGGNVANPDAKVTGKIGRDKSYEKLTAASERPVDVSGPHDPAYTARYNQKWRPAAHSYADLRTNGKFRCKPDTTHAPAAHRENEASLHKIIDKVAIPRRRQIARNRQNTLALWQRDQRQSKRLLYFMKAPRTWFELDCFIDLLAWVLSKPKLVYLGAIRILWESTSKSVNCVSDEAAAVSKERDKRGTPKRQRVVFLTRAEELDLARLAKAGDITARNRLFLAQWPQVAKIARAHAAPRATTEDLIQEAYGGVNDEGSPVGLVYALDKYDPGRGVRFSAFATQAIEWAIKDYKKRQYAAEMVVLDAAVSENIAATGAYDAYTEPESKTNTTRTSRSIRNRIVRGNMTVHISPYVSGLAPETHDFIAELNAEAIRLNGKVRFTGLANRIEATGPTEIEAQSATMGGWLLRRAFKAGYPEGEEAVLRKGNSQWRKKLRKLAKRKPK